MYKTLNQKKPRAATANQHPFFCYNKNVRKNALETPEYLSQQDWSLARRALGCENHVSLLELVFASSEAAEAFFYRIIGWPEGMSYMRDPDYAQYAMEGLKRHEWPKLQKAVQIHNSMQ